MKKVFISVLAIIFIISMITVVHAASGSILLTTSAKQVVKGNTFTVTLEGTADENITGLEAALSYDTTKLSLDNKSVGTGFSDLSGNNEEIAIASTSSDSLSTSGTLYTLTFKVLDTAQEGETTISVTNGKLALVNESQTQENVTVSDTSTIVTIKTDETTAGGQNGSGTNTGTGTGTGSGTNTGMSGGTVTQKQTPSTNTSNDNNSKHPTSTTSSNFDDSETGKELPQTGVEVVSIIAIAGLTIFAIISYILYKKYNNI